MAQKTTEDGKRRVRKATSAQTSKVQAVSKNQVPSPKATNGNLEEQIRRRAYELYLQRGGVPGNENQDWLVAEQEVRSQLMEHAS
jgi:Protein of unknown function (DUF2934)